MAEARRKAPHSTSVIQKWVDDYARAEGVAASRLQRWIWFMIVLALLDRVRDEQGEPLFLLKGGAAMELRFQLEARTTKDIDTVFREAMPSLLQRLDEALQAGWGDFTYERSEPEVITDTRSVRLAVKLSYRGKRWGTVQLEVAPAEGRSRRRRRDTRRDRHRPVRARRASADPVPRHPVPDRPEAPRWPPELVVYPSWPAAFAALADDQGFDVTDVEEAARQVLEMVERINAATD